MSRKPPYHRTVPFAILCGSTLFLAAAVILSVRARSIEKEHPSGTPEPVAPLPPATIGEVLPQGTVLAPWKPDGEPMTFGPDNLFDLINGGADVYVDNGFREVISAWYEDRSGGGNNLTVQVFDMADPANAEIMYRLENPDAPPGPGLVGGGCRSIQSTIFWKGPYYIKIETEDLTGEGAKTLEPVAREIDARLAAWDKQ